jgi:hypothetical protein
MPTIYEQDGCDLLYCDVHDAYLCPVGDHWIDAACGDSGCSYCVGRQARPSACGDPDRHYGTD